MRDPQDRFDFDGYERLEADMKREFADCAWWFNTAALTAEETAEQLVAGAPSRPDPAPWVERLVASAPPGVERLPAAVLARMLGIHVAVAWQRAPPATGPAGAAHRADLIRGAGRNGVRRFGGGSR